MSPIRVFPNKGAGRSPIHERLRAAATERTGSAVEDGQDRGGEAVVALPEPAFLEERRGAGAGLADAVEQGGLGGSHDRAEGLRCE